jgi:hypothetical protein
VLSMRNKVNRLEEIFMQLVEGRAGAAEAQRNGSPQAPAASRPQLPIGLP